MVFPEYPLLMVEQEQKVHFRYLLLKLLVDAQNETNWAIEENNLEEDLNLIANGLNYNLKMGYVVPMQKFS